MNALPQVKTDPEAFATLQMKKRGYTVYAAGEAVHIAQCQPIQCTINHLEDCYHELPLICEDKALFLKPNSRIITNVATPVNCNRLLPTYFELQGIWQQLVPQAVRVDPPQLQAPQQRPVWRYEELRDIATHGIYRPEELERLQNILPSTQRPAILESVARQLANKYNPIGTPDLSRLIDPRSIEKIAQSTFSRFWTSFTKFGITAAGILAIIMILQMFKFISDTLIRGYALYFVYGWSAHLLAAIWSALTHLFLSLTKPREI